MAALDSKASTADDDTAIIEQSKAACFNITLANCGLKKTADDIAWRTVLVNEGLKLTVFDADVPRSTNRRFKGVIMLPWDPETVFGAMADNSARMNWDRNIKLLEQTQIQSDPFPVFILHCVTKPVLSISSRDFVDCVVQMRFSEPTLPAGPDNFSLPAGSIVSAGTGIERDPRFPETPGIVRGFNTPSGWVFEPVPQADGSVHTRVHYHIHSDLKGWLPAALVNSSIAGSLVNFFNDLTASMRAGGAQKK